MSDLKLSECPSYIQPFLINLQKQLDELSSEVEAKKSECYLRGERIAELEKERDARDLEQQANGVSRFAELHLGEHSLYSSFAKNYCSVLLMQAKQLRAEVK